MAILKIIDFISPQSGSIIIQAASAQAQSGGDYDGDKYFAKRFNAIKIGNHWSKVSQDVFNRTELAEFNRQEAIKYLTKDSVFKNIFQEHRSELDYHNYFEQYLKAMEKHKSRAELDNIYLDSALGLASNYYLIKSGLQRENTDASLKLFKKVTKNELIAASEIKRGKMLGFPSSNVKNEREVNKNAKSIERAAFSNMLSVVLNDVGASISARHTLGGKFAFDQVITIKNEKVKGYIKESDEKFCALKNEHMKFLGLKGTEKYVAEEVDLMSKRLAILISVSIDAFKNDFTYGINLTDYTLDVLLSGTMLNIPRNILLGITTHPLVRELTRGENASDDIKEYRTRLLDYIKKSKDDTILAGKEGKKRIKHPEMIIEDLFMYGKGTYSLDIEKKDVRTALAEYRILKLMNDLSDFNNNALFLSSLSSINKGDMEVSSMYNLLNVLDSNVTSTSTSKKEISRINRKYLKGLITEEQQKEELKIVRQNHKNNIKSESTKKSENLKLSEHYGIDLSQISFPRQEGNINYEDLRNFKLFSAYTDSIKMFLGLVRESSLVSKEAINLFNTLHLTRFDINTPNIASVVRDAVNVRNYTNLTKVSAFIEHFTKSSEGKFVYFKEIESEEDKVNKANTIEDFYPNPPFNEANIPVVLELMVNYLKNKFPNNTFVEKLSVWGGSVVFLNYSGSNDLNKESIKNDLEVLIDPGNGIMNQPITDKLGNKLNMSVRQLVEGILKREMYTSGVRWSNKSVVPFIPADFYKDLTEKTRKWNELIKSPKASIGTISLTDMITRLNLSLQNNVQESVLSLLKIKKDTSKELTGLSFLKEANEDEEASGTIVDTFYTDTDASYLLHKGVKYKVFKIDEDRNIAVALIGWKEKYDRQNVSDYERDKIDIYKKPKTLQTVEDLDREAEEEEDNHDKGLNEILSNSLGRLSEQDRENKRVEIIKHNLLSRFNKEEALTEHLKTNNTRIILTPNSVIEISLYDPKVGSFIDRSTNYYGLGINSFSTFGDVVQVITPEDFRKSAGTEDRLSDVILNNIEGLEDKALRIKISRKTYTQDTKMIYYEKGELKQVPIETGFITNEEGTPEKMITGLFSTYLFRHDLEFQDDIDKFNHVIERLPDNQKKEVSEVLINLFSNKYGKEVIRKLNEEVAKVEEDKLKEKNQSLVVNQNTEENNNNSLSNTENKIPAKVINQTSPC